MQACDGVKKCCCARADLVDTDHRLAVAENNSRVPGEKRAERRDIHRVDRREEVARVRTGCGAHRIPPSSFGSGVSIKIGDLSFSLQEVDHVMSEERQAYAREQADRFWASWRQRVDGERYVTLQARTCSEWGSRQRAIEIDVDLDVF